MSFFQVLGLEFAEVEVDALLMQRGVNLHAGVRRDEAGQLYTRAQQLERHAHVHLRGPLAVMALVGFDEHAQVLRPCLGMRFRVARRCSRRRFLFERREQALRFLNLDLARRQHV